MSEDDIKNIAGHSIITSSTSILIAAGASRGQVRAYGGWQSNVGETVYARNKDIIQITLQIFEKIQSLDIHEGFHYLM